MKPTEGEITKKLLTHHFVTIVKICEMLIIFLFLQDRIANAFPRVLAVEVVCGSFNTFRDIVGRFTETIGVALQQPYSSDG